MVCKTIIRGFESRSHLRFSRYTSRMRAPAGVFLLLLTSPCLAARHHHYTSEDEAKEQIAQASYVLDTGDWNDRIRTVHELDYLGPVAVPALELAAEDADWQVRMAAAHALGSEATKPDGADAIPVLRFIMKRDACPVVRLIALHWLGTLGPEGQEENDLALLYDANTRDINNCPVHPEPGRAPWA